MYMAHKYKGRLFLTLARMKLPLICACSLTFLLFFYMKTCLSAMSVYYQGPAFLVFPEKRNIAPQVFAQIISITKRSLSIIDMPTYQSYVNTDITNFLGVINIIHQGYTIGAKTITHQGSK